MSQNFFSSSPLAILWHARFKQLDEKTLDQYTKEARCSFFFFFFEDTQIFFFLFLPHKFSALSLSEIMGDDVKEFTNEERSLLKFQKKQQHGQVLLLLLLLVLVYSFIRKVLLYCFCL